MIRMLVDFNDIFCYCLKMFSYIKIPITRLSFIYVLTVFCTLLLNYVHSVGAGDPPCLTSAMISMAASENAYISQRASDAYKAEMQRRIASHIPSEKGLVNYHRDSMRAALEVLKDGLIIDDEHIYEEQAMVNIKLFIFTNELLFKTYACIYCLLTLLFQYLFQY